MPAGEDPKHVTAANGRDQHTTVTLCFRFVAINRDAGRGTWVCVSTVALLITA